MTQFSQGDKVKIKKPRGAGRKIYPDSGYPSGLTVNHNGQRLFLKWGTIFKVSSYTSEPVASMDSQPVPLIQRDWINSKPEINALFTLVEPADS